MGAPQYEQAGADIGGTGNPNTIPRWTGPSTLGDSGLTDDGSVITSSRRFDVTNLSGIRVGTGADYLRLSQSGTTSFIDALSTNGTLRFRVNAGGTDAIFASAAGNVGIGTTSPATSLANTSSANDDGANAVSATAISWITNQIGYAAGIWNKFGAVGNGLFVRSSDTSASTRVLHICAGAGAVPNSLMFVRGDGNVGIGTATPATKLEVVAGTAIPARFATSNGTTCVVRLLQSGQREWGIQIPASSTSLSFYDYSAAQERMVIDVNGNVILGTATSATIQAAGTSQGLKLQGTGGTNNTDPNVLDFYADGGTPNSGGVTWTPVVKFGGTDITTLGGAYDSRVGRYTRIGNMVYATFWLKLTAKGTATGLVTIAGLPTSANVPGLHASGAVGIIANITFTNQMTAALLANSAELRLYETTNAGLVTTITDADFAANSELAISIAYPVN